MAVDLDGNYVPKQKKTKKSKMNQKIDQAVKPKTFEEQVLTLLKKNNELLETQNKQNARLLGIFESAYVDSISNDEIDNLFDLADETNENSDK